MVSICKQQRAWSITCAGNLDFFSQDFFFVKFTLHHYHSLIVDLSNKEVVVGFPVLFSRSLRSLDLVSVVLVIVVVWAFTRSNDQTVTKI